jgi:hypothetical protein
MKKMLLIFAAVCLSGLMRAQDIAEVSASGSLKKAEISLADNSFDFGSIKPNKPVSHTFVIKNTGGVPLIINRVATSCGCTAGDYPKEAILPNKTAEITITYNSSGTGAFNKTATVYSNAVNETLVLNIKGVVE